jgi:hypothetical protein
VTARSTAARRSATPTSAVAPARHPPGRRRSLPSPHLPNRPGLALPEEREVSAAPSVHHESVMSCLLSEGSIHGACH